MISSGHPSFVPSTTNYPSLQPTFHPSQSVVPSSPPSRTVSPSSTPTTSQSPTVHVFCGEITIDTDDTHAYGETSWKVSRISTEGGRTVTLGVVAEGSPEKDVSTEKLCLESGDYDFTIFDDGANGICCKFAYGRYYLIMEGVVLAEGGDFGYKESVSFSLPLTKMF